MASEFELINLFKDIGSEYHLKNGIVVPSGDDCAVLESKKSLVTSVDSSIESVHFPKDISPGKMAYRSIAVALSDIAAMGCKPLGFSLSISNLTDEIDWYKNFANGVKEISDEYEISLIGGDFVKGPLNINVIVFGEPYQNKVLKRNGAKVGDIICISKPVGSAKKGLEELKAGIKDSENIRNYLQPKPKFDLGRAIVEKATSCIDTSDGLLTDLKHILEQSNVGADIYLDTIPFTSSIEDLNAGDDYDLCFTMSENDLEDNFYRIGKITKDKSINFISEKGYDVEINGYKHFK